MRAHTGVKEKSDPSQYRERSSSWGGFLQTRESGYVCAFEDGELGWKFFLQSDIGRRTLISIDDAYQRRIRLTRYTLSDI